MASFIPKQLTDSESREDRAVRRSVNLPQGSTARAIRAAKRAAAAEKEAERATKLIAALNSVSTATNAATGAATVAIKSGADAGEGKSASTGISDVFNMISIQKLAEEIGKKIQQSGSASANIIRRVDQGDAATQTRGLTEYRKLLDKTISNIMVNRIKKTIDDVLKRIKSGIKKQTGKKKQKYQKMKNKLDKNKDAFLSGLTERVERAIIGFKMIDIDPGASKTTSSYTKLFDTLFGEGFQTSYTARGDILNKVADSQQCKIILQKRLKGELPFLYDYSPNFDIVANEERVVDTNISLKDAFEWEKKNGKCYLCGVPYSLGLDSRQLECEHVLSIFLALRFISIVRGKEYTPEEWRILNLEYELSHKCCNRIKDQIAFIMANGNRFLINDDEINAFYMNISKQDSMGCPTVWENIKLHHNKNISNDDISKAKAFLTKRLQYIVEHLNSIHGGSSQEWAEALSNFNAFKKISVDGRQIFQLHLCHSIIKALSVLTIEQLFVIIDRSFKNRTEFTAGQQDVFDDTVGEDVLGESALGNEVSSKNGGGKTNKNQKGGNKIVSDAIKALKEEFIKIIESDEPIIEEKDIFKHLLLTYGAPGIEPHTHYYVNDGNVRIQGSLTNGVQLLYDDDILNEKIDLLYYNSKQVYQEENDFIISEITQNIIENFPGMDPELIKKQITNIESQGNLNKFMEAFEEFQYNKMMTLQNQSLQNQSLQNQSLQNQYPYLNKFTLENRIPVPVYGGKKKRKKRRTRKLKRKKKRKSRRKRTRRKKKK